jgi:hypothetical protein
MRFASLKIRGESEPTAGIFTTRIRTAHGVAKMKEIRLSVGRATMRHEDLAAWDFDRENLACPEHSKTCAISSDDGRYLDEPGQAELTSIIEELRPEPNGPSYFMLLFRNRAYLQAWMQPEGVRTEIRQWHDIRERHFTHWRAATAENPLVCRTIGGIPLAEENLLQLKEVGQLALAFREAPNALPKHQGVFCHVTQEAP